METLRTGKQGHRFFKSGDCASWPVCEREKVSGGGSSTCSASPHVMPLLHQGINTLERLSEYAENEILKLHGIAKTSLPLFRTSLQEQGLNFKPQEEKRNR